MRYQVKGCEVRSENAAKPGSSAGRWLLKWIDGLDPLYKGLDLGCGKLRYTVPMSRQLRSVTAVDSKVQIDRVQALFGCNSTIRQYAAAHLANVRVFSVEEQAWQRRHYDIILCANVLSAIPSKRVRKELVSCAHQRLRNGGTFLLTTQFQNSHFSKWAADPRASRHCDGYLVRGTKGASFYALLDRDKLVALCRGAGLSIIDCGHAKELAYVFATKEIAQTSPRRSKHTP